MYHMAIYIGKYKLYIIVHRIYALLVWLLLPLQLSDCKKRNSLTCWFKHQIYPGRKYLISITASSDDLLSQIFIVNFTVLKTVALQVVCYYCIFLLYRIVYTYLRYRIYEMFNVCSTTAKLMFILNQCFFWRKEFK